MIRREYEENWENKTTDQTVDDADEKTVMAFFESAISCGRLPVIEYDKRKILDQLGVLNGNHLTNAGVCLFSSRKPITVNYPPPAHAEVGASRSEILTSLFYPAMPVAPTR